MSAKTVALGGMFTAFSLLLLLATAVLPSFDYALPAMAGVLPAVLLMRGDKRAGIMVFAAASVLALLLLPRRDVAIYYILLFGHYPLTKSALEHLKPRVLEYLAKLLVCAASLGAMARLFSFIAGLPELEYPVGIFLLAGTAVFFLYDYALTRALGLIWKKIGKVDR